MTVKELIDILQEYPQDLEVWSLDIFGNPGEVDKDSIDIETTCGGRGGKYVVIWGE